MPWFDPFGKPAVGHTPHQRILEYLEKRDSVKPDDSYPRRLNKLPNELIDNILQFIADKKDLAAVCRVNSRLFANAMPCLYEKLQINVSSKLDSRLSQMFTTENAGLKLIRELVLTLDAAFYQDPKVAYQWLVIICNQIPADILRVFRWNSSHAIPASLSGNLWRRQKQLTGLELLPSPAHNGNSHLRDIDDTTDLLAEVEKPAFEKVQSLRVVADNAATLLAACAVLRRLEPEALEVDGVMWSDPDDGTNANSHSGNGAHDELTSRLFSHLTKAERGHLPTHELLTSLVLKDIDLSLCKHTWYRYLCLNKLQHLALEHCTGTDLFLGKLGDGADSPKLRTLKIIHTLGNSQDCTVRNITELLQFPKNTLKKLELCLRNAPSLPDYSSIMNHSETLEVLLVDVMSNKGQNAGQLHHFYPQDQLDDLTVECGKLRQLGIAFPALHLEFLDFERECGHFAKHIDVLVENTELETLCVLNFPTDYKPSMSPGYYAAKNVQLARLANAIFRRYRLYDWEANDGTLCDVETESHLEVVSFGTLATGGIQPVYFVESEIRSFQEVGRHVATKTLKQLRNQALELDVVDYEERKFDKHARQSPYLYNTGYSEWIE